MKQLVKAVKLTFEQKFSASPIIIASPGRINLIGGHTDYNKGLVFPAAIDKYIVSAFSKTEHNQTQIYSIDLDEKLVLHLSDLSKQKAGSWKNYVIGVIAEIEKAGKKVSNFNLVFGGNIPLGAGLSSSAALENSVVFGLNELFHLGFSKEEMIQISMKAEHNYAGVQCGIMDQFSSMFGQQNHALFLNCANMAYQTIPITLTDHQFILINTNVKHELSDSPYNQRKSECEEGFHFLRTKFSNLTSLSTASVEQLKKYKNEIRPVVYQRCLFILEENERVKTAKNNIENNRWEDLGQLLFDTHDGLQNLYDISCDELDFLVELAKSHEAVLGSRLLGGGFGGCTLNLVKKENLKNFIQEAEKKFQSKFGHMVDIYPVSISNGTQIIEL